MKGPHGYDPEESVAPPSQNDAEAHSSPAGYANLVESMSALAQLSSARLPLEELLVRIATYAVQAIPGADGAGLTLNESDRTNTIVMSAPFVGAVDDIQYGIGEGPCISAAAEGVPMRSGSLGGDPRWPRFGPRVGRLGVHSALSLPLSSATGVIGAMNVYAHAKNAFDEDAEKLGQAFAVPAAVTAQNRQILAQAERLATRLQGALINRPMIDQAIGIIRSRTGVGTPEAFEKLRVMSQHGHRKLSTVAEEMVEQAVSRARARQSPQ